MAATSVNNNDQIFKMKIHQHPRILTDTQLFSIPGEDDETDFDGTTEIDNTEKESSTKPPEASVPIRPWSDFSLTTSSSTNRKHPSRSYKFIQLERALSSANLIQTKDDQTQFENEYLTSLHEDTFENFLQKYHQKINEHYEQIKKERELKQARIFTFADLEKNFLALDPTKNIKIIFIDKPNSSSTITRTTNTRSTASAQQKSTSSVISNETAVESFYTNRSQRLLSNPSNARHEITLFARRTAERLHERLPRMSSVPHRVKIVDERDTSGKPDERTLLQMKHKRALSLITKRRQLIFKMMTQAKKNEIKMEQQWQQPPLALDNSAYCRELLERANQIEHVYREEHMRRPQTGIISRRTPSKNFSSSTSSDITPTTNSTIAPSVSSCSAPFQDALSIHHIEKTKNIRVILPTRPLTAPTKVNWVNYC